MAGGVEYQVTKVDPTDPETKGMVYQVHKVDEVTAYVSGKFYRARIVKNPNEPTVKGKVYQIVLIDDPEDPSVKGMVYNAILTGDSEVVVVGPAPSPLSLPDAVADSLSYVKAFGGTEQRDIPDNYLQRQFIYMMEESYIKVEDLPISAGYKVEFDFQTLTLSSPLRNYIGGRSADVSAGGGFRLSKLANNNQNRVVLYGFESGTEYYDPTTQFQPDTRYKYTYNNGVCTLESGGSVVSTQTFTVTDTTSTPWGINIYYGSGSWSTSNKSDGIYVYSLKVWNTQGELVMNLVPAVQKGTVPVVGFYDAVTGGFRTATDGTFAAGGEAVPTPDAPINIVSNNGVLKYRDTELPVGYRRILGMTMNNDCYYQTTTYPTGADTLKFSYEWTSETACNVLGCYTTSSAQDNISLYIGSNPTAKYLRYDGGTASSYSLANKRYDVQITPTGSIGMEIEDTWEQKTFTCSVPLCIGITGATATSAKFIGNLYGNVEIVGVTKFIPCERVSDGEIGYYDTANETFITPTGTTPTSLGYDYSHYAVIADGTVETIEDTIGNTATAEMLLKIGNYQDVQSIVDGIVTRNVGVKVLDGTETGWARGINSIYIDGLINDAIGYSANNPAIICSHFRGFPPSSTVSTIPDLSAKLGASNQPKRIYFIYDAMTTAAQFQQFLADQYAAGTPVMVIYPLATETTESVAGQTLQVTDGDNTLEILQASIDDLELEAEYEKEVD